MSTLKVNNLQVGQDATATNNFTLYQPAVPDGTVRLGVGNFGSVTDALAVKSNGTIGIGNLSSWSLAGVSNLIGIKLSGTTGDGISLYSNQITAESYVTIGAQYSSGNLNNGSQIRFGIDSSGNTTSMIAFATATGNGNAPTEKVRIKNNGNVGIGTTDPGAKLQINTVTGTTGLKIIGVDTDGYSDLDINSVGTSGYSRLFFSDTAGQSGSIIYAHSANSLQFKTGGSISATLGGDGLIVGDFTPIDTRNAGGVQVAHSKGISFRSNTSQSVSRNWRIRNDDWGWGNLDFGVGDSVSDVSDSAGDTVLSLTSSRNVGIGTTNPTGKFSVYNSSSVTSSVNIDSVGRVLIGTTAQISSSSEKLTVADGMTFLKNNSANVAPLYLRNEDFTASTYQPYLTMQDGGGNRGAIGIENNTSSLWMSGQNAIIFRGGSSAPGNAELMRITGTGNVGIGTTNPNTSLTVNGSINVEKAVYGNQFSDSLTVDTGLYVGDVSNFAHAVIEVIVSGNPNHFGSGYYRASSTYLVHIGTGWTGSNISTIINPTRVSYGVGGSGNSSEVTATFVLYRSSNNTEYNSGTARSSGDQLRVKIAGCSTSSGARCFVKVLSNDSYLV